MDILARNLKENQKDIIERRLIKYMNKERLGHHDKIRRNMSTT